MKLSGSESWLACEFDGPVVEGQLAVELATLKELVALMLALRPCIVLRLIVSC